MKLSIILMFMAFSTLLGACTEGNLVIPVSMSALLSSPEKFDGDQVSVVGYLGRGADLYLTEEHSRVDDRSSALILNLESSERTEIINSSCAGKYVEVVGTFGLVHISGLTPRLGITQVNSIKDKVTRTPCNSFQYFEIGINFGVHPIRSLKH
ncbi:hypothetical protein [Microbulbifer sp. JMSA003]|uniref:hypothetical protein n=1 Tax=Microbulbifer sp. JMSA003 TaxID=3243369 RepID=UPI0040396D36